MFLCLRPRASSLQMGAILRVELPPSAPPRPTPHPSPTPAGPILNLHCPVRSVHSTSCLPATPPFPIHKLPMANSMPGLIWCSQCSQRVVHSTVVNSPQLAQLTLTCASGKKLLVADSQCQHELHYFSSKSRGGGGGGGVLRAQDRQHLASV